MSIIRWSPAIICIVVTTGLADYERGEDGK